MDNATRSEVVFARVMQRAPDLITDEQTAGLGRWMGNIVHCVGPAWKVFMLSAGSDVPEYVTVGIGKNLPGRIGRLEKASPIPVRVAIYTMVPAFKLALQLHKETNKYLKELFPHSENGWYHVPGENFSLATAIMSDVSGDYDFATSLYRFDPHINNHALDDLKEKLIGLKDEIEDGIAFQ